MALVEGMYVCNERVSVGTFYAIIGKEVNYIPLMSTKKQGQSS